MAENFERHRSTRWVKSKSQSYDAWGDGYDDYNYESEDHLDKITEDEHASSVTQNPAPLVLSIDQRGNIDDSLDEDVAFSGENHVMSNDNADYDHIGESTGFAAHRQHKDDNHLDSEHHELSVSQERKVPPALPVISTHGLKDDLDFFPPTPTFSMHQYVRPQTPETPHLERSYTSDTDLIQREPESLNLAHNQELNKIREELPVRLETHAPELVLTIDRMNLDSSDDSSDDDGLYKRPSDTYGVDTPTHEYDEIVDAEHAKARLYDSSADENNADPNLEEDDDDWGYNSEHSSNFEVEHLRPADRVGTTESGHHVQTDALDSLINDLLQMERLSTYRTVQKDEYNVEQKDVHNVEQKDVHNVEQKDEHNVEQKDEHNVEQKEEQKEEDEEVIDHENNHTAGEIKHDSVRELPSLSSIHDLSLPDFENEKTDRIDTYNVLPPDFQQQHATFLLNVLSRSPSVRKAPLAVQTYSRGSESGDASPIASSDVLGDTTPKDMDARGVYGAEPESEDVSASRVPDSMSPVSPTLNESTHHSQESLLPDESIQESNHETHFEPDQDHLVDNPAGLSITDPTLEPVLLTGSMSTGNASFDVGSINPSEPDLSRRVSTVSNQTFNFGSWKPNTNKYRDQFVALNDTESQMNVSLDDNYTRFTSQRPPSSIAESFANTSMDSIPETIDAPLPSIDEDDDDTREITHLTDTFPTVDTNTASVLKEQLYEERFNEKITPAVSLEQLPELRKTSELTSISTLKPPSQKYPVFSWKQIMGTSQPVDRIEKLRQAQVDEMNYDTGLHYWLSEILKSAETAPHIQIGKIATQAYQNAQHSDLRRHTSIRSKVSLVKDKMETGNFGLQASSLGRKFLSRGKKLMKSGSD